MKARLKGDKATPEIILDYAGSNFSADEVIKQIATKLHDNHTIHTLIIEHAQLFEKGTQALRQAVLGHPSLRKLVLYELTFYSYPKMLTDVVEADYFFPTDLDAAVQHFCAILRDARLETIEITELSLWIAQFVNFNISTWLNRQQCEIFYLKKNNHFILLK